MGKSVGAVFEQVFFIVSHWVSEVDGFHTPAPALKFVDYPPTVILFVDGIVRAEGGGIEVIGLGLVGMLRFSFSTDPKSILA